MRDAQTELDRIETEILPSLEGAKPFDMRLWKIRDEFTSNSAWAIPTSKVIDEIAEFVGGDFVVDVGCGHALWSALLKDKGVNILALDLEGEQREHYCRAGEDFMEVTLKCFPGTIAAFLHERNPDALMFVWPSYDEPWAYDYTQLVKPRKIVYVGENQGGCTADDCFHNMLRDLYRVRRLCIPQFYGLHDEVYLCTRK